MTVDGLGCLIWWELGFQPEIVDLRIIKKKKADSLSHSHHELGTDLMSVVVLT